MESVAKNEQTKRVSHNTNNAAPSHAAAHRLQRLQLYTYNASNYTPPSASNYTPPKATIIHLQRLQLDTSNASNYMLLC